jgi:hypothetical protein
MLSNALISACGLFRYWLTRTWDPALPVLVFVMLNPSTADARLDDPTIRKCIEFARRMGYGGIVVVNLFAFRATNPKDLKAAGYQVGRDNDQYIKEACQGRDVVCAWGSNARGLARPSVVLALLRAWGVMPMALRLTDDGVPWHPLMLSYNDADGQPRRLIPMP